MELLERETARRELEQALYEARNGNGRITLVSGEAGIGKTMLVQQFAQQQTEQARLLWGACDAMFTPCPFGPLYDMAVQMEGKLPHLLHTIANRALLFSTCLHELQKQPTIVVIEDVHWADEATLDLLKYLGRRIHLTQTLLILTYRDDELNARHPLRLLIGDLATSTALRRLSLSPLSVAAVQQLMGKHTFDAQTVHRQTNGNPFFITEMLAAGGNGIPPTVRDVVLARAARLSASGRAVLEATAVIGQRIEPWLLRAICGREETAVSESLEAGILLVKDDHFVFRHELARQTILNEILPQQRLQWHQAILDTLKSSPLSKKEVARLAHHAAAANDCEAIRVYAPVAAKEAASSGMNRSAASLYALALSCADSFSLLEQIELYEAYAKSLQRESDRCSTIAAYRHAIKLAHEANLPQRAGLNMVRLSLMLEVTHALTESNQLLTEALAILEPLNAHDELILAYQALARKHLKRGEHDAALGYAQKSHQLALAVEDTENVIKSLHVLGLCWLPFDHAKGRQQMEESLALSLEHKRFWIAGAVYSNLTTACLDVYDFKRAEELIGQGLPFGNEFDLDYLVISMESRQAMVDLYHGRWNEATRKTKTLIHRSDLLPFALYPTLLTHGRTLIRRGNDCAKNVIEKASLGFQAANNRRRLASAYAVRAEAAWLAGDKRQTVIEAGELFAEAVAHRHPGFAAELAYWLWRAGEAVETFDWMATPFVLEIKGDWQGAVAAWEALGCPYEQARALADGDVAAQKRALVIFEQLGAQPMIQRVRQQLQQAGALTIPRGPRSATKGNPFQLTNRQMDIWALLAENLTNGEIAARLHISPKTVDHHVSAVLGKLQVSSRQEAGQIGRQHLNT
ncbi:MAG: AAA family ATPase [Chloroflexota bacterium]